MHFRRRPTLSVILIPWLSCSPPGQADGGVSLALAASGRLLYAKESRHLAEEEEEQILARIDEEKSSFQLGGDPWGTDRLVVVMKSRFFWMESGGNPFTG